MSHSAPGLLVLRRDDAVGTACRERAMLARATSPERARRWATILLAFLALPALHASAQTTVTFRIDMRPALAAGWFDAGSEVVGIRGSAEPLSWAVTLPALDPDGDGVFETTVSFPDSREPLKYKFKVDGVDNPNDGWETHRDWIVERSGGVRAESRAFDAEPPALPPSFTGTVEQIADVQSEWLEESRDVWVWLPPGYGESSERYPVLYLHDGQNVFDAASAGVEWAVDETATRLVEEGRIRPAIIAGVASTSARMAEYTPSPGSGRFQGGGSGRDYGRFLTDELKPLIDSRFRTIPSQTALGGSSLGGLISVFLGAEWPEVFEGLLVVSPSVWWDNQKILDLIRDKDLSRAKVWLDMGTGEGDQMVDGARALRDLLSDGFLDPVALHYEEVPGAGHNEAAWAARVEGMLLFLYGL